MSSSPSKVSPHQTSPTTPAAAADNDGNPAVPVPPAQQSSAAGKATPVQKKRSSTPPPPKTASATMTISKPVTRDSLLRTYSLRNDDFLKTSGKDGSDEEEEGSYKIDVQVDITTSPEVAEFDSAGKYNQEIIADIIKIYFGKGISSDARDSIGSMTTSELLEKYSPSEYEKMFLSQDRQPEYNSLFFDNSKLLDYSKNESTVSEIKFIVDVYEAKRVAAQNAYIDKIANSILEGTIKWFRTGKKYPLLETDKPATLIPTTQEILDSSFILSQRLLEKYASYCEEEFVKKCKGKGEIVERVRKLVNDGLEKLRKNILFDESMISEAISLFVVNTKEIKKLWDIINKRNAPCDIWPLVQDISKSEICITVCCEKKNGRKVSEWLKGISKKKKKKISEIDYNFIKISFVKINGTNPKDRTFDGKSTDGHKIGDILWFRLLDDKSGEAIIAEYVKKPQETQISDFFEKNMAKKEEAIKKITRWTAENTNIRHRKSSICEGTQRHGEKKGFFSNFFPGSKHKHESKCDEPFCDLFYDEEHMKSCYPSLCPDLFCESKDEKHIKSHVHVCRDGGICKDIKNKEHLSHTIHIRPTCQNPNCANKSPEHLVLEHGCIREWCTNPKCRRSDPDHMEKYLHGPLPESPVSFENLLTAGGREPPNFEANVEGWMRATREYLGCDIREVNREFEKIVAWFDGFRDVHQCSLGALKSIKEMGAVTSLNMLSNTWRSIEELSRLVWMKPKAASLTETYYKEENKNVLHAARKFVNAYCRIVQGEKSKTILDELTSKVVLGVPVDSLKFAFGVFRGVPEISDKERAAYESAEAEARKLKINVDELKGCVNEVVESLKKTLENVKAIDFDVDKEIGTDKTVFCVHGPNMGDYGDAEVSIVFKDVISRHPDAFLTPVAAMGYYQGWYIENSRVSTNRPWAGEAKSWNTGAREDYRKSIFQVGARSCSEACAMEWICRVVQNGHTRAGPAREPRDVTLRDVQDLWLNSDPHSAVEAHLPGFIPIDGIKCVYIKEGLDSANDVCNAIKGLGIQCDVVADTKKAVWDMMDTSSSSFSSSSASLTHPVREGYSFFVGGNCHECTIPVDLFARGIRSVLFNVVNGGFTDDLMITLSDKAAGSDNRHCVAFKIPPFDTNAYAYDRIPENSNESVKPVSVSEGFTSNTKHLINYSVCIENGLIKLAHFGVSAQVNRKELAIKTEIPNIRFITFMASEYPMTIHDLVVSKNTLKSKGVTGTGPSKPKHGLSQTIAIVTPQSSVSSVNRSTSPVPQTAANTTPSSSSSSTTTPKTPSKSSTPPPIPPVKSLKSTTPQNVPSQPSSGSPTPPPPPKSSPPPIPSVKTSAPPSVISVQNDSVVSLSENKNESQSKSEQNEKAVACLPSAAPVNDNASDEPEPADEIPVDVNADNQMEKTIAFSQSNSIFDDISNEPEEADEIPIGPVDRPVFKSREVDEIPIGPVDRPVLKPESQNCPQPQTQPMTSPFTFQNGFQQQQQQQSFHNVSSSNPSSQYQQQPQQGSQNLFAVQVPPQQQQTSLISGWNQQSVSQSQQSAWAVSGTQNVQSSVIQQQQQQYQHQPQQFLSQPQQFQSQQQQQQYQPQPQQFLSQPQQPQFQQQQAQWSFSNSQPVQSSNFQQPQFQSQSQQWNQQSQYHQ